MTWGRRRRTWCFVVLRCTHSMAVEMWYVLMVLCHTEAMPGVTPSCMSQSVVLTF